MQTKHIEHLREICQQQKLDGFLISTNSNIFYLSGFSAFLTTEHDGFLLVTKKAVHMLTTPLYSEAVKQYIPDAILHETTQDEWYTDLLKKIVKNEQLSKIGFEPHDLRYSEYHEFSQEKIHLVPASLRTLRTIKANEEIKHITEASRISDETFLYIAKHLKAGITEKQVAWEMEKFMKEKGAQLAFQETIVAFGHHAALIHHLTTDKKLEKDAFVLMDFGAKVNAYCSDLSRTVFFGKPTDQQKKLHQTVLTAQEKAIDLIKKNTKCKTADVDKTARQVITKAGFPDYPHALGHGVGLDIHESPVLSAYAKDVLEPGMVFTLEPGIYLPGVGGVRIEDMFAMTDKGLEQLTTSTKELLVLS